MVNTLSNAFSRTDPYKNCPLPGTLNHPPDSTQSSYTRFIQLELTEDGTISCTLRIAPIGPDRGFEFEALSYTWGAEQPTKHLFLNGSPFIVRQNLWLALHRILRDREARHSEEGTPNAAPYLWIDALSINQENVLERNHQVQFMRDIFTQATLVLVCVNTSANNVHLAVEEIRRHKPVSPDYLDLYNLRPQTIHALRRFFSQRYWMRMWIIQEVVMARDLRFLYGDEHFTWAEFHSTMLYLSQSIVATHCRTHASSLVRKGYEFIRNSGAWSIYRARTLQKDDIFFDIFDLVSAFHLQKCVDPRDKIFALLGVAANTAGLQANYMLSREELFELALDAIPKSIGMAKQSPHALAVTLELVLDLTRDIARIQHVNARLRRLGYEDRSWDERLNLDVRYSFATFFLLLFLVFELVGWSSFIA